MFASAFATAGRVRRTGILAAIGMSLGVAACAGNGLNLPPLDTTGTLNPAMPAVGRPAPDASPGTAPLPPPPSGGPADTSGSSFVLPLGGNFVQAAVPPLEAYARIIRHSRGCWFGLDGLLEASHVLHADAEPLEKGGRVVITIHERYVGGKTIWGARAFEIALSPIGEGSSLALANTKLPAAHADAMSRDAEIWMRDQPACMLRSMLPSAAAAGPPLPSRRPPTPPHLAKAKKKKNR